MAGTATYLFKQIYVDGREPDYVLSLAPVKVPLYFFNGSYRDLNATFPVSLATGTAQFMLAESMITPASSVGTPQLPKSTDTFAFVDVTTGAITLNSYPDDILHIPPRALIEAYDVWQFTNAAGDVVSTVKATDLLNYVPMGIAPIAQDVTPVTPSDTNLLPQVTNYLYCVGSGNVVVGYVGGGQDTITVQANSVRAIQVNQVYSTGTTATGILVW